MNDEQRLEATRDRLQDIHARYGAVVLANSLGAEDMVLTDLTARLGLPFGVFCLDTGRLPSETYDLLDRLPEHYPALTLSVYYPDAEALAAWVGQHGVNAFYRGVELRQACCHLRKVEPLARALAGQQAWITGMRREQSSTRSELPFEAFDDDHGLMKFNPLADWQEADVWRYIREHQVPYNALHDKHYPSIGCAPCTRAIAVGEDLRAGRWWWENPETKECGLHVRIPQG
ncbi:MAG: phosphoadenylyl-sulfate reductase [Paludibacterium sp.]|uniref:phosphoadenylyl-sulfate reductase n=1 Tax=Paludibacterium sp. TaxID=1917523 RepID=UPI0025E5A330|nr:phosphoadenylyl-sulfate reductase [Paludibacterium sp.]MBV8045917.1 phosphoadenylyl-sulfate reductase [Paludibacterium sp.]MBV8648578.1 phosphoadenylyl-sulfate reductase [Paludibacterium sp.]